MRHYGIAHSWVAHQTFFGELRSIISKRLAKHQMTTQNKFWEYCNDFVKTCLFFASFLAHIWGKEPTKPTNLWSMCGEFMAPPFLSMMAACLESERETHGDSLKPSSDCMCCKMHRVINYTKKSQGNELGRVINHTKMPLHQNMFFELIA